MRATVVSEEEVVDEEMEAKEAEWEDVVELVVVLVVATEEMQQVKSFPSKLPFGIKLATAKL